MTNATIKAVAYSELQNICIHQIICTYYFLVQNKPIICSHTMGTVHVSRQVNRPVIGDAVKLDSDRGAALHVLVLTLSSKK